MKTLRGALIGCGFFAQNHLHAWKGLDGVEIVALCDQEQARAESYAQTFEIADIYTDAEEMLDALELDFVDIATQAPTHRALVEFAAGRGVSVICQKPLAPSLEEARAIVAATKDITFMVHENFRWQRPMLELKQAAVQIGEPFYGRVSFRSGFDVYANQPYLKTDERFILYDLGVHLFDLTRFFLGEAQSLLCHTARVNPEIKGEDVATALLEMHNGAHAVVEMSYASQLEDEIFPQTLVHLEGLEGSAVLGADYQITVKGKFGVQKIDASPEGFSWATTPPNAIPESVVNIQQHFVECLRENKTPDTSGEDNLKTLELTFGAYESAADNKLLNLEGT